MITGIIEMVFKVAFPKAPPWIGVLLSTAIPAVIDLVEAAGDTDKTGADKFAFVSSEVRDLLDEALDSLPEWSDYPEEGRDRIIGGLTELAVFVHQMAEDDGTRAARRKVRKALRKLR